MEQIVSITSRGQLTLPKKMRDAIGVRGSSKALVRKEGDIIVVKAKKSFNDLSGSLESRVSLSDKELAKARKSFAKAWARKK